MIEEMAIALIKDVGVPVGAFIMMYALYLRTQQWQQKNQVNTEQRFERLVKNFIDTTKDVSDKYSVALQKQADAIIKNTECIAENTANLKEHIRQKDEFMDFIKEERRG